MLPNYVIHREKDRTEVAIVLQNFGNVISSVFTIAVKSQGDSKKKECVEKQ